MKAYGAAIENIHVYDNLGIAFIPFDCPDALIAMVSDFILALDIIEVSVIYAKRADGYKFSIRSEAGKLDAGRIISRALFHIGNGGGHAAFAGGFVPKASIESMGDAVHKRIRALFIEEIGL